MKLALICAILVISTLPAVQASGGAFIFVSSHQTPVTFSQPVVYFNAVVTPPPLVVQQSRFAAFVAAKPLFPVTQQSRFAANINVRAPPLVVQENAFAGSIQVRSNIQQFPVVAEPPDLSTRVRFATNIRPSFLESRPPTFVARIQARQIPIAQLPAGRTTIILRNLDAEFDP